jgi:hypothetical protein
MWHVGQRSNSASKFPTSERLIVWVFEAWMIMSTCTRFGRSFWEELGIVREILYMYIWLYMHAACYLIHTQAIQVYICNLSTSGNIDLGSRFSELALGKKRGRVGHLSHHVLILTRCKVSMSNLGYPACCFLFVLAVYSWLIYSCLFSHFRSNSKMLIRGWSILASSYSSFFETWQTRPQSNLRRSPLPLQRCCEARDLTRKENGSLQLLGSRKKRPKVLQDLSSMMFPPDFPGFHLLELFAPGSMKH